jgi:hypothetical protein
MSAYICNPEHIGVLAAFAALNDCQIYDWRTGSLISTAQAVAKGLARENIRSVAYRYPNDKDGSRPGPCLLDADIEEAAAIYAAHFVTRPQKLKPVQVFKLSQGLSYQSCETDDWTMTLAARQLDWINNEAARQLPGYEAADWSFDKPVRGIEALYAKEA